MGKYDRFYPAMPMAEEDTRPLGKWHKILLALFGMVALWVWLTPDAPSCEITMVPTKRVHTIHIHRRVCGMEGCRVVDVTLHPRVI